MYLSRTELLLAQIRSYLMLAKSLKSQYYIDRARSTLELLKIEQGHKTAILSVA